jgi:agmatinase
LKTLGGFNENTVFISQGRLFGLPFSPRDAECVIIPCPWDVTVSFRGGTADGPRAVLAASDQIDLYDESYPDLWKDGIALADFSGKWRKTSKSLRGDARFCLEYMEGKNEIPKNPSLRKKWDKINKASVNFNAWVKKESEKYLKEGQLVGVLGGEHSVPFGLLQALSDIHPSFGILHIDSHLDLRDSYAGFKFSHASTMRNTHSIGAIKKFVHVGIRDYCREEANFVQNSKKRSVMFTDRMISREIMEGKPWKSISQKIIRNLPKKVYVSFDIDGLKAEYCPNTGTPLPGGLDFEQTFYLIEEILRSGRKIIGFDMSEVAPAPSDPKTWSEDWNAIVGSRVLYRLSLAALKSKN